MDMTIDELVKSLRSCADLPSADIGCSGCKFAALYEAACTDLLLRHAADQIECDQKEIAELRKEIEWKDMVIALAQKKQTEAEAEMDKLKEKVGQYRALIPSWVIPKEDTL